jgi:FkbM family methyltransferase
MISFAQNHEDVLLARAFRGRSEGFYIDIGAMHPTEDSVTRHFYDCGWSGVNVEPIEAYWRELERERPRDVNLRRVLGDREGTARIARVHDTGLSTLDPVLAEKARAAGRTVSFEEVPMETLATLCRREVRGSIDFLKIDVEGWEAPVIRGADWATFRPVVVLVEATLPGSTVPAYEEWEPLLLEAGYRFACSDGLNRFYVRRESSELVERLAVPPNVLDGYVPVRLWRAERELERLRAQNRALKARQYFGLRGLVKRLRGAHPR